ncbi:peptidase family M1-domain-containing protein [Naematelia encephala]|uniref:Peptidase family M1-domain-containing protein n=1 Tax=Naematelia encephala TaxID=71784 RepID=A0A1Y2BKR5_9TREE|nr:peptidase family M1-domain-containing protein [Naematelia encephala]
MSFSTSFTESKSHFDLDRATLSNYLSIRTTHIDLTWSIDWKTQIFSGDAVVKLEVTDEGGVEEIVLDTSYLDIQKVEVDGQQVTWKLAERLPGVMGSALHVQTGKKLVKGDDVEVKVSYKTTKECTAVGWLNPVQTKSGKYPYLYSQSQAIHARSLLPCQDTPAIKATYSAKVKSILPVLMSGLRKSPPSEEVLEPGKEVEYVYDQPVAIPSYLIAIASGELIYRPFKQLEGRKWKSGCWTEPLTMDAAFWEFSEDTAKFVATAEDLTSEYRFGVYDILFLPESFPYGGMENSCLTFATPSVIAGDRSSVDLAAHEISHSWFGNGIGCASWAHFWLNEGWTTYLERLLMREVHGEPERQLSYIVGRRGLKQDLKLYKDQPRFQRLVMEYKEHEDPDEGYNQVPYEKGSNFLLYLERTVGGLEHFVPYMKDYDRTFSGTSITTDQWRAHLFHYFGSQPDGKEYLRKLGKVDWEAWLHGDGLDLCVDNQYDDSLSKPCIELADRWDAARDAATTSFSPSDVANFSTTQKVVFLDKLEATPALPPKLIALLDETYGVHEKDNAEIRLRFYQVALKSGPEYADKAAAWVVNKGRMKFCRPVYRLLFQQKPDLAKKTFLEHAAFYHPIARKMIARDLGVSVD